MKKTNYLFSTLILVIFLAGCNETKKEIYTQSLFENPSVNSQVHTWWHWMNGNITKEGITRDLESMKAQGISQATILNIGLIDYQDSTIKHVGFNTPEWYAMFRWALEEAKRLDIKIGIHNCDGWNSSGGPWISPEQSMKQYVWSKTIVEGGKEIKQKITKPYAEKDFYVDVALIAFPSNTTLSSFQQAQPRVSIKDSTISTLTDGCPVSGVKANKEEAVSFAFSSEFVAQKITLHPRKTFMWGAMDDFKSSYQLFASNDGKIYKKISTFEVTGLNKTFEIEIPETKAKYFQLKVSDFSNNNSWITFMISEVELLKKDELPLYSAFDLHLEKTAQVKASSNHFIDLAVNTERKVPSSTQVININKMLDEEGNLTWEAPAGNWTIIRFGYTTTGVTNGPATAEGVGLECDKMDTAAVAYHFRSFPDKLIKTAGDMAGNTFKFLLIDSWECHFQNWTGSFIEQFDQRRGYDITNWIPVLCGEVLDDAATTDAFLYDFRKTIAEMLEDNYYIKFRDLCHANHLEMHAEAIYGSSQYPPLDIMRTNSIADMQMFEFWSGHNGNTTTPESLPKAAIDHGFPQYAAAAYNSPLVGAEAYTAMAHLSESPRELKPFGDKAYCSGINQFILHSYVHQPNESTLMTLGQFSSHFNRNNPYWNYADNWMKYHARIQYILQKGLRTATAIHFIGDQLPQTLDNETFYPVSVNYTFNLCNADILKTLEVKKGKVCMESGLQYELITIPNQNTMELSSLEILSQLVKEGAILYGPKPLRTLSLSNYVQNNKKLKMLADQMWGANDEPISIDNNYGKGKIIWGKSLQQVYNDLAITSDFSTNSNDSLVFLYIKKQMPNADIFFVNNQQSSIQNRECKFKTKYKKVEILYPESGIVETPLIYAVEGDIVRVPYSFRPLESAIFIFSEEKDQIHYESVEKAGTKIFPSAKADSTTIVPKVIKTKEKEIFTSNESGEYTFIKTDKSELSKNLSSPKRTAIQVLNGKITFKPYYKENISDIAFETFESLSSSKDLSIKYFGGTAIYTFSFKLDESILQSNDSILLSLGKIGCIASVELNAVKLGTIWQNDGCIAVKSILKAENTITIEVANELRNRIIGDLNQYKQVKNVKMVSDITNFLNKDKILKPTGLCGSLELIAIPME